MQVPGRGHKQGRGMAEGRHQEKVVSKDPVLTWYEAIKYFSYQISHLVKMFMFQIFSSYISHQEVEGTPAKKSRRGKEPTVTHSPSLRQAKHSGENKPRVIFTGLVDKQGEKVGK